MQNNSNMFINISNSHRKYIEKENQQIHVFPFTCDYCRKVLWIYINNIKQQRTQIYKTWTFKVKENVSMTYNYYQ